MAGEVNAAARPRRRPQATGLTAAAQGSTTPAARQEGSHAAEAQAAKEWANEALRKMSPKYVHDDYVPPFDGGAKDADMVCPPSLHILTLILTLNNPCNYLPYRPLQVSFAFDVAVRVPYLNRGLDRDLPNCVCDLMERYYRAAH